MAGPTSPPDFQCDVRLNGLPVAPDDHRHHIARLLGPQRIREVIKILDGLSTKLDQQIAGFQAGLSGWTIRTDVGKQKAVEIVAEIRDRPKIRTIATAGGIAWILWALLTDFCILRPHLC